ncbi:MAG TPA: glycine cleavage system protein GcvH [Ignavibacteria bacterium]|nr:glycine cleavage system protein GcvH [Ignavibacteria bacterium]HMQ99831.1 glycine cleavage system protein GcvH [Ignavibacteria bacterium]
MNIPEGLKYTKDHEWVKVEGNIGTVGVTDYAQGELGDIIYLDVTTVGNDVAMGDAFGTIEAVKTVSDMYAPVSGKIAEFNSAVNDNPAIVNQDPYGAGWMVKIEISNMGDLDSLLSPEEYKNLIGG